MTLKITLNLIHNSHFALQADRKLEELNPKEMLLYASAACLGHTIIGLLKEHIGSLKDMELSIEGTLSTPSLVAESRFSHFHVTYRAECPRQKDQIIVSRAVNLANDKYCGMLQMLRRIAPLTHETSIVTTDETSY